MMILKGPIVLMYHGVFAGDNDIPPGRAAGAGIYDVSLADFYKQMEYLKSQRYPVTTLEALEQNDKPNVVLTFDDGEMNNFSNAFDILRQLNFGAYFFVTVNHIGKKGYMGWEDLKSLRKAGMLIGSHGLNHEIMVNLEDRKIEKELYESKMILERNLNVTIDYFSVPRGFVNRKIIVIAKAVGYKKILISDTPTDFESDCIRRIAVKHDWSLTRLKQALSGHVPFNEVSTGLVRDSLKKIMGAAGYDRIRSFLLNGKK